MSMRYSGLAMRSFIIGQQAVAAGDEHRSVAEPVEQTDGVVDASGAFVLEWSGNLHVPRVFARLSGASMSG